MSDRHESELLDTFFDALARDPEAPAPVGLAPHDAAVARHVAALERTGGEPSPELSARIWTRVLQDVPTAYPRQPTRPRVAPPNVVPLRGRWRLFKPGPWLAWTAALLLLVLVGGTVVSLSPEVQAQVVRLRCLVPGLGVRSCESPGLVSTQVVSAASNGLAAQVLGLQASAEGTHVRVRLGGLPVSTSTDAGQEQRFRDALPVVQQIQILPIQLRDDHSQILPPVVPEGAAWPGTAQTAGRSARILSYWMEPAPDATWRLWVTAEWAFGPLDPNVRSVDLVVPAPPGPLEVHVPLVPIDGAGLPHLGDEGAEVAGHGVALRVTGVAATAQTMTLQVAARSVSTAEQVVGLSRYEAGQAGRIWGLILWDDQGHQHIESTFGPPETDVEAGVFLQTLTFPALPTGARPSTLEVPSVLMVADTPPASITIPLNGHQIGDRIPLGTPLSLGQHGLQAQGATLNAGSTGRELVVDLDVGEAHDGRALLGVGAIQVAGRDDLRPQVTVADAPGQPRRLRVQVPLPPDIGPQVTLAFSGAVEEVPGPWRLPIQPAPDAQP